MTVVPIKKANITPRPLSLADISAEDKAYGGTTAATYGASLADVEPGDTVILNAPDANFADAEAGDDKAVTIDAFAITGADAGNYNLIQPDGLTANITPAETDWSWLWWLLGLLGVGSVFAGVSILWWFTGFFIALLAYFAIPLIIPDIYLVDIFGR